MKGKIKLLAIAGLALLSTGVLVNAQDSESIKQEVTEIDSQIAELEDKKNELLSQLDEDFVFNINEPLDPLASERQFSITFKRTELKENDLYLFYEFKVDERESDDMETRKIFKFLDVIQETPTEIIEYGSSIENSDYREIDGYLPALTQLTVKIRPGGSIKLYKVIELEDTETPVKIVYGYKDENNLNQVIEYVINLQ